MSYDVVIVGAGPAGLSAALALGRARKRVLLCDSGPRRNAAAEHIYNFVTRDGTRPDEFRDIANRQLGKYPNVEARHIRVASISGRRGAFSVDLSSDIGEARRVLLCTGMIDEMLPIDGFRDLWGQGVFQCPYCHGWEVQDRRFGYLARAADAARLLPFALMLRGWTRDLTVFMADAFEIPVETRTQLRTSGIRLETALVGRLVRRAHQLAAIELSNGTSVPCDVLFAHPPQRHVDLVGGLALDLDDEGYVRVNAMTRETSVPGIYAAGDLTTRAQGAILAAAAGMQAAASLNVELMMDLASVPLATPPA